MYCVEKSGSGRPVTSEKVSLMGGKKNRCCSKLSVFRYHKFDYKAHPTAFSLNPVMARIQLMIGEGVFATGVSGVFPILFYLGFCHAKPKCLIGEHRTVFIYHVSAVVILILLSAPLAWERLRAPQALLKLQLSIYDRFVLPKGFSSIDSNGYDALPLGHSACDMNDQLSDIQFMKNTFEEINTIRLQPITFLCFKFAQKKAALFHKFVHIVFYVIPYNFLLYYILALISGVYQDARTGKANDPTDISFLAWCIIAVCTVVNVIMRYNYDPIVRDINASLKRIDLMLAQAIRLPRCEINNPSGVMASQVGEKVSFSTHDADNKSALVDLAAMVDDNSLNASAENLRSWSDGFRQRVPGC